MESTHCQNEITDIDFLLIFGLMLVDFEDDDIKDRVTLQDFEKKNLVKAFILSSSVKILKDPCLSSSFPLTELEQ